VLRLLVYSIGMLVIGLDPAPAKGGTIFDGAFQHLRPRELGEYLEDLSNRKDVLICWDAPLTGPQDASQPGQSLRDFTQRPIETFFSRQDYGFKTPSGISVRGYAGCPHWTISKAYLGLPRIGPWDRPDTELPYHLLTTREFRDSGASGPFVVEVHPAVAIWRWCVNQLPSDANWLYKKSMDTQKTITDLIMSICPVNVPRPSNDDELDALVAWMLGTSWVRGNDGVELLGNGRSGSFLLPHSDDLYRAFDSFLAAEEI